MNVGMGGRVGALQRQPRQRRRAPPAGGEGGGNGGSNGRSDYRTKSALQGRLEEINLMVLHVDGRNSYQNMTLRALYNYVMSAITSRPAGAAPCPPTMTPTSASDVLAHPSPKSPVCRQKPLLVPDLKRQSEESSSHPHSPSTSVNPMRRERTCSVAAEDETGASLPPPPPLLFGTEARVSAGGASGSESDRTPVSGTHHVANSRLAESSSSGVGRHGQRVSFLSPPTHRGSIVPPPLAPMNRRTATVGSLRPSSLGEISLGESSVNTGSGGAAGVGNDEGPGGAPPQHVTYRERLGGYLHPRDMRRLVTPFSSSNAPELMVRRHVMLLNFDPLRAIVLRDRLLVIVPTGADSILMNLEQRLRGGLDEVENEVFGDQEEKEQGDLVELELGYNDAHLDAVAVGSSLNKESAVTEILDEDSAEKADEFIIDEPSRPLVDAHVPSCADSLAEGTEEIPPKVPLQSPEKSHFTEEGAMGDDLCKTERTVISENERDDNIEGKAEEANSSTSASSTEQSWEYDMKADEWEDIEGKNWIEMPFELQAVDAVLSSACSMLADEACELERGVKEAIALLRGEKGKGTGVGKGRRWATRRPKPGEHAQERLRVQKDKVGEMEARVQGFVRAMNLTLDEDEDMALMNLSRLLTHPERFIQPVSQDMLEEESDEPELILEGYLQQALSAVNALQLLKGQITSTEELVNMMLDTVRNRLLFINTFLSLVSLCVTVGSFVGSIFGMNLLNGLEEDGDAFRQVVVGTCVGCFVMLVAMAFAFNMAMSVNKYTH